MPPFFPCLNWWRPAQAEKFTTNDRHSTGEIGKAQAVSIRAQRPGLESHKSRCVKRIPDGGIQGQTVRFIA